MRPVGHRLPFFQQQHLNILFSTSQVACLRTLLSSPLSPFLSPFTSQDTFVAQTKTIAGFEDNANYGFGANQMTGSQKNLLIFGSLAAFFALFLAGYALE